MGDLWQQTPAISFISTELFMQCYVTYLVLEFCKRYGGLKVSSDILYGLLVLKLAFLDFEAAFDSSHGGSLLNALRADRVPGKRHEEKNNCCDPNTSWIFYTVQSGSWTLFGLPLVDLEYTDDVAVFASSSAKLQHVVNLASKLAAAYGMRSALINVSSCGSPRDPPREIRVDGQPIELVDEFCYLGCMVKTMAAIKGKYSAKMRLSYFGIQLIQDASLVNYANEVKLQVYLSAVRPIIMYGSERGSAGDGNGKA
ncbi:hypothetical protein RB195_017882 [Necator americanus]|uniref:Reverse transcriptase domain-containing protein n=1 Tax=Necator americanus TaxID=51031 RepID=A0ABR1C9H0_NECAM